MDSILLSIYNEGKYYNPAWNHYGRKTNVVCDRCKTTQLKVCIGWNKYDLCMKCVDQISRHIREPEIDPRDMTLMMQSMFMTNMEQGMFRDDRNLTYMAQDMFDTDEYMRPRTKMMQGKFNK